MLLIPFLQWWSSYNYVLSAALDTGVAIATVMIFLIFYLPKRFVGLVWISKFNADAVILGILCGSNGLEIR